MNVNMHESIGKKFWELLGIYFRRSWVGFPAGPRNFVEAFFFMMSLVAMSLEAWDRER